MTSQNLFHATPSDPITTGFYFTDLKSYRAEYAHFGPAQYELRLITGDLAAFHGI